MQMMIEVENIYIHDKIYEYIVSLVTATRNDEYIKQGGSPRAGIALAKMAAAHAFLEGRKYCVPSDVQKVFKEVLIHRINLNTAAKGNDLSKEEILDNILKKTEEEIMKRFIFLFVILIATLVLSLIYREEAPMRLFAAELVFLFIVHLFAVLNALLIRFNGWQTPARINLGNTENEKIEVFFSGGMFPFPVKGVMKFEVCNTRLKDGKAIIDIPFSMSAGRKTIVFPVVMLNAGLLQLRPVSAVIFEATGQKKKKKKIREKERSLLIYPESFSLLVNNEKGIDFSLGNDDSEFYTDRPGDDPSEVFDRREFRNGDKLSRVDWKLSAREKKIMVKEMSAPIPEPVCLILGLAKGAAEKINSCMSLFYSVSLALNSEKIRFSVMIPGGTAGSYEILHVKDDETLS